MIQGFNPRTGQATGEPVAEAGDADVDAIVAAAVAASGEWAASRRRAEALDAVADALDARVTDLVAMGRRDRARGRPAHR